MTKKLQVAIGLFFFVDLLYFIWYLLRNNAFPVLQPAGIIAAGEHNLILMSFILGAVIGVFVLGLTFFVVWTYRAGNTKARYTPDWENDTKITAVTWAFVGGIIAFFCGIALYSSHALDPFKPLQSSIKPLTIQVVALQWKWLFIYPEQRIATVNYIAFPAKTPVTFELTADAPMNSFWIPQLGGQMYAMAGMVNRTHLMADTVGEYAGSTAEISGTGFAGMRFVAKATTQEAFDAWVSQVQQSQKKMTWDEYTLLVKPSSYEKAAYYSLQDENLYNKVVGQFMAPSMNLEHGMEM